MRFIVLAAAILAVTGAAKAASQAKTENCGWLIQDGEVLVPKSDPDLKPSDSAPLAQPPAGAKAAYCARDTLMSYVGDERVLKAGLPFIIRNGDREGVLEADPTVMFNYHKVGNQYLPGKAAN